jgi:hypothetical protein
MKNIMIGPTIIWKNRECLCILVVCFALVSLSLTNRSRSCILYSILCYYTCSPGARILTVFLYLNDVEGGGGTHFNGMNMTVMPKRGRAVLWPSVLDEAPMVMDDRTFHEAMEVTAGLKYGANAWFHSRDEKGYLKDCRDDDAAEEEEEEFDEDEEDFDDGEEEFDDGEEEEEFDDGEEEFDDGEEEDVGETEEQEL